MMLRLLLLLTCLVVAPASFVQADLLGPWQERAARQAIEGRWRATIGSVTVDLTLSEDGVFTLDDLSGRYLLEGETLTLTNGDVVNYTWRLEGETLTLSGGDLRQPVAFVRAGRLPRYLVWVWDTTPEAIGQRLHRILIIIGIVLIARLIIWALREGSELLIFSNRGPLAYFYRRHQNRARTIHSLVLNVVKYFIYFTALGMILAELGINYTTYIASLSVIGLAIGFGSQGLVQDMVTGFFIIFEGQFDVGDMVEISGQTGYVTEIGLRMTKIRNYPGQIVVIPNRNIATVANYSRGAQRAYVDVAIARPEDAARALTVLRTLGEQVQQQYDGVVLPPVKVSGPMQLATGETFVRLHFSLWPNQTWVVDQQVIPRLRERLKAETIENPSDRVTAFYHAREIVPVPRWRERLRWIREHLEPQPTDPGSGI